MIGSRGSRRASVLVGLVLLCAGVLPALAQVDIEKYTNGQDADLPPGPVLPVGSTVNWTYVVTNAGGRDLNSISVTDDQGVTVTCPATTLGAGLSMTCTASGTAQSGQYANVGTVNALESISQTQVSDSDPSHYFGQTQAAVTIEKRTEGFDADTPPGPSLPVGAAVSWTYEVTNVGADPLSGVTVTDDRGVTVTCPGDTLAPGASMTCNASGTVQPGQYANLGTVIANLPNEDQTGASDPSHYFGQALQITKRTNGIESNVPPGPTLVPGAAVSWTYEVENPGPATVTGLTVTDDQGVVVTCGVTTLAAGESVTCTGSGTVQAGQYVNVGTAEATLPLGGKIGASDSGYYFGNPISILKSTNGFDANVPPGPAVLVGSTVNWTYLITNSAGETLTAVSVTDNQGVTVTCPSTTIAASGTMTCTASGVAVAGQYANVGTVDATSSTYGALSASDASHYFGQTDLLDFGDAPDPTFQTVLASNGARHVLGSAIYLGACVDAEADGLQSVSADGDDLDTGTAFGTCAVAGDDEDGVTFTSSLARGLTASVSVVASAPCTLSAWIDFNGDGDWGEASDDLFPGGIALAAGTNPLTFTVPAGAALGTSHARFRCTTQGSVSFTGEAPDGEVEDYRVAVAATLSVVEIPALGTWGAALLLLLFAGLALSRLRRRGASRAS